MKGITYWSTEHIHVYVCTQLSVSAAVPELRTANSQRSFSVEAAAAEFDMKLWR